MQRFITHTLISATVILAGAAADGCSQKKEKARTESAASMMQDLVQEISQKARKAHPGFIVVPQNGIELAFEHADPKQPLDQDYLEAIDALGVEELFYYEKLAIDSTRLMTLRRLIDQKPVLVSDFVSGKDNIRDDIKRNAAEGFVPFVRDGKNYHYHLIPKDYPEESKRDITRMRQVRNYLYLLNLEDFDSKEQAVKAVENTNYDMVVLDLYYDKYNPFTAEDISRLKRKANGGKRLVLCYLNVGAAEKWRTYWGPKWQLGQPDFLRRAYEGYDDEIYVAYWDSRWKDILFAGEDNYLDKIIKAGFDGTYLDNTEAYVEVFKKSK